MSDTAPGPEPAPAPADSIPPVTNQEQPAPAEQPVQNGIAPAVSAAPSQPVSAPSNISPPPPPPPAPTSASHPQPAQSAPVPSSLQQQPQPQPQPQPHPQPQPQQQPQHIPDQQLKELLQQGIQHSTQPTLPQAPAPAPQQPQQQVPQQPLQAVPQASLQSTFQQAPQPIAQHPPPQVPHQTPQQAPQPAPQQPLQQQQQQPVNATPPVQFVQSHPPATTQPPADVSSLPAIPENHAFTQAPPQQPQMPVAFNSVMTMQGPTIAQYYPDMSGRVSSPDGYDLIDSSRLGRTKKDVKRRTKTGCLTCRKRRIKCDERHPVCRNCEKSKRDCLGYDPIFKNQPGQSPIQPAPSQQPSLLVAPQNPSVAAPQPLPPQNHSQHQVAPGAPAYSPPSQPAIVPAPAPAEQPYDFSAPPVPSTEGATPAPTVASQNTTEHFISTDPMANAMEGADKLQLRQANIEELFSIRGQIAQPLEPLAGTPARIEDIKMLFLSYANGIDQLLECKWYEEKALPHLLANNRLLAQYTSLLDGFTHPQVEEAPFLAALESREARIIWDTMTLCRQAQAQNPPSDSDPLTTRDKELLLAVKRLSILESLILGTTLTHNPVGSDVYPEADASVRHSALGSQIKAREMQFWEAIGRYLVIQEDDPERDKARDHTVMWTRTLLDSLENRDIIYSILVVRHICKYQPYKLKPLVGSTDEKDTAAKLFVALKFLEDENMGRATNQVVKRITGMILAYWEHAHYNLS